MNRWLVMSIVVTSVACGGGSHSAEQATVDTTMVFIAMPPPSPADSANAPSADSVLATIRAYRENRIAADVAAPIVVNYLMVGGTVEYSKAGGPTNVERERDLHLAIDREFERRSARARTP